MKKEKKTRETKNTIFSEMKVSDMADIDRKIHGLLIAEGFTLECIQKHEGWEKNNYTDVNNIQYRRGERERVIIYAHHQVQPKKTA